MLRIILEFAMHNLKWLSNEIFLFFLIKTWYFSTSVNIPSVLFVTGGQFVTMVVDIGNFFKIWSQNLKAPFEIHFK